MTKTNFRGRCLLPLPPASAQSDGPSEDWRVDEFNIADIHWRKLDIETIVENAWADKPDLTHVEEIGFTDLMRGGGSPASSRVDWIEVYGARRPLSAAASR